MIQLKPFYTILNLSKPYVLLAPILVNNAPTIYSKRRQVKFQLKKVLCMGVAVGNVGMTPDELRPNGDTTDMSQWQIVTKKDGT